MRRCGGGRGGGRGQPPDALEEMYRTVTVSNQLLHNQIVLPNVETTPLVGRIDVDNDIRGGLCAQLYYAVLSERGG